MAPNQEQVAESTAASPDGIQIQVTAPEKDTSGTPESSQEKPQASQASEPAQEGDEEKPKSKDSRCIAVLAINGFVLGATFQSVIYKVLALEDKIGLWDWTLLRNLLILILALIGLASKKINPFKAVPRAKWGVLFGRVVTSLLLNMFMNVSLELIPYSLLVVLYQTNPFMTSILSYCVNGEKINIIEALGMVLSFTAVGFIAYSAEQSSEVEEEVEEENGKSATEYLLGIGFILAAAACVSGSAVLNRSLKTINFNVVMVYQGIFGILVASSYEIGRIIISGSDESVLRLASLLDASDGGLLALGLFMDAGSIFCLTIAYQKSEAGFVSLVGFVRIVYALFVDLFIFEESIGFIEIAGSGVICLVTIVVAIDKIIKQSAMKKAQQAAQKPEKAEESTDDNADNKV